MFLYLVIIKSWGILIFFPILLLFLAAIVCPALTAPTNGQVSYDMTSPYQIGTEATFTCNAGFSLNGAVDMLTCADDDQSDTVGTWGGTEPTCPRKSIITRYLFIQVTFRRHDHLVSVLFGDLLSHSYNITFPMFLYLVTVVFERKNYVFEEQLSVCKVSICLRGQ